MIFKIMKLIRHTKDLNNSLKDSREFQDNKNFRKLIDLIPLINPTSNKIYFNLIKMIN